MTDLVDAALGELISSEALAGWDAEVVFDAPDRDWSTRRTQPIVDAFLYAARYFVLSYLISTWARRNQPDLRAKRTPRASRPSRGVPPPVMRRPGAPDGSPTRDHIEEP